MANYNGKVRYYITTARGANDQVVHQLVSYSRQHAEDSAHFLLTNKRVESVEVAEYVRDSDFTVFTRDGQQLFATDERRKP